MASEVTICNQALLRCGVKAIIQSRSDDSEEAEACDAFFDQVRDRVLASFNWPFARRKKELALLLEEDLEWEYVYQLPSDCMIVRRLTVGLRQVLSDQEIPYEMRSATAGETRVLCCDVPNVTAVYTAKVTDPTKWSPLFCDALSWLLAHELAMPMSVKPELQQAFFRNAQMAIGEAAAQAFREQREDFPLDSEFILERR